MNKFLIGLIFTFIILSILVLVILIWGVIPEYDKILGTIAGIIGIIGIGLISKLSNNSSSKIISSSGEINGGVSLGEIWNTVTNKVANLFGVADNNDNDNSDDTNNNDNDDNTNDELLLLYRIENFKNIVDLDPRTKQSIFDKLCNFIKNNSNYSLENIVNLEYIYNKAFSNEQRNNNQKKFNYIFSKLTDKEKNSLNEKRRELGELFEMLGEDKLSQDLAKIIKKEILEKQKQKIENLNKINERLTEIERKRQLPVEYKEKKRQLPIEYKEKKRQLPVEYQEKNRQLPVVYIPNKIQQGTALPIIDFQNSANWPASDKESIFNKLYNNIKEGNINIENLVRLQYIYDKMSNIQKDQNLNKYNEIFNELTDKEKEIINAKLKEFIINMKSDKLEKKIMKKKLSEQEKEKIEKELQAQKDAEEQARKDVEKAEQAKKAVEEKLNIQISEVIEEVIKDVEEQARLAQKVAEEQARLAKQTAEQARQTAEQARQAAEEARQVEDEARKVEEVRQAEEQAILAQKVAEEQAILAQKVAEEQARLAKQAAEEVRQAEEQAILAQKVAEEARQAAEEELLNSIQNEFYDSKPNKSLQKKIKIRNPKKVQSKTLEEVRQAAEEKFKIRGQKVIEAARKAAEELKIQQAELSDMLQIKINKEKELENIQKNLDNQNQEIILEENNIIEESNKIKIIDNKNSIKFSLIVNILKRTDKLRKLKKPKIMRKPNNIDKNDELNNKINEVIEICKEFYNININNPNILSIIEMENLQNFNLFIDTCFDTQFIEFLNNLDDNMKSINKINDLIDTINNYYIVFAYKMIHYNLLHISNIDDKIKSINDTINEDTALKIEKNNGYYNITKGNLINLYSDFINNAINPLIDRLKQDKSSTQEIKKVSKPSKKFEYLWADYKDFVSATKNNSWDFYTNFNEYNENETMKIEDYDDIITSKINSNLDSNIQEVSDIMKEMLDTIDETNKKTIESKEQNLIDKLNRVLYSSDIKIQYIKIQSRKDLNLDLCVPYIDQIIEELNLLKEVKILVDNTKNEKIKEYVSKIELYIKNCEYFITECNEKIKEETTKKPTSESSLTTPVSETERVPGRAPGTGAPGSTLTTPVSETERVPGSVPAKGTSGRVPGRVPGISSVIYDSDLPLISATTPFKKVENKNTEFDKYLNNLLNSSI